MNLPAFSTARIAPMSREAFARVTRLEEHLLTLPQTPITTHHLIHAGLYARTIIIPKNVALTGAPIKRATVLILQGNAIVYYGEHSSQLIGYHVLAASAHRKQAFFAVEDTHLTMLFATDVADIHAAEEEFTDEAERLFSRAGANVINITGE